MKPLKLFALLVVISTIVSCKKEQQQAAVMPPPTIPVVEVIQKDITGYDSYPINIEGKINNAVRAKISGYIKEVYVDEGQFVSKGQPMFRLETDVQSQDANAARSAITAADANISAAKAAVNAAQVEVDKLVPLVEQNIISNVQLETAKANLMRAKGQLQQAQAGKSQAQAGLGAIQANIGYSVVRSPISGVVGTLNFKEGSLVGPADPTPITTVSETSTVHAYFSMSEGEYLNFLEATEGKTVKEKLSHLPEVDLILANGKPYDKKGKIQTVTGQVDPQTGTMQFRAVFNNSEGLLSNGNSGFIHIPKHYENVLIIPENATYERQGQIYTYLAKNDTVFVTPIEVDSRLNNLAIIKSGLKAGDIVAAQGLAKLRDRAAITPQKTSIDSVTTVKPIM